MDDAKASTVYRLYDAHEALLYIGVTRNPPSRWKDHRKEMLWWPEVTDKHKLSSALASAQSGQSMAGVPFGR